MFAGQVAFLGPRRAPPGLRPGLLGQLDTWAPFLHSLPSRLPRDEGEGDGKGAPDPVQERTEEWRGCPGGLFPHRAAGGIQFIGSVDLPSQGLHGSMKPPTVGPGLVPVPRSGRAQDTWRSPDGERWAGRWAPWVRRVPTPPGVLQNPPVVGGGGRCAHPWGQGSAGCGLLPWGYVLLPPRGTV